MIIFILIIKYYIYTFFQKFKEDIIFYQYNLFVDKNIYYLYL